MKTKLSVLLMLLPLLCFGQSVLRNPATTNEIPPFAGVDTNVIIVSGAGVEKANGVYTWRPGEGNYQSQNATIDENTDGVIVKQAVFGSSGYFRFNVRCGPGNIGRDIYTNGGTTANPVSPYLSSSSQYGTNPAPRVVHPISPDLIYSPQTNPSAKTGFLKAVAITNSENIVNTKIEIDPSGGGSSTTNFDSITITNEITFASQAWLTLGDGVGLFSFRDSSGEFATLNRAGGINVYGSITGEYLDCSNLHASSKVDANVGEFGDWKMNSGGTQVLEFGGTSSSGYGAIGQGGAANGDYSFAGYGATVSGVGSFGLAVANIGAASQAQFANFGAAGSAVYGDANFACPQGLISGDFCFAAPAAQVEGSGSFGFPATIVDADNAVSCGANVNNTKPNSFKLGLDLDMTNNVMTALGVVTPTLSAATNSALITTSSNPTNSFVTGTLYTNVAQRSMLVGSAVLSSVIAGGGNANITLDYTNNGVGYSLPMQKGAGIAVTDFIPFCVPLSTNATFKFTATMSGGSSGHITNVVNWKQ